jgi:hypothetical protein
MRSFEHLRKIRQSVSVRNPELNRLQLYEDFARVLWHAYQDLMCLRDTTDQRQRKCFSITLGVRWQTCSPSSLKPVFRLCGRSEKSR